MKKDLKSGKTKKCMFPFVHAYETHFTSIYKY